MKTSRPLGVLLLVVLTALFAACSFFGGEKVSDDPGEQLDLVNVVLNKPVLASSEGKAGGVDYPGKNAVDGIISKESRWLNNGNLGPPYWLEIDLEGTYEVHNAVVHTGNGDGSTKYAVGEFSLQYWHDEDWVDIPGGSIEGNTDTQVNLTFDEPVIATKLRFYSEEDPTPTEGFRFIRVVEIIVNGVEVEEEEGV